MSTRSRQTNLALAAVLCAMAAPTQADVYTGVGADDVPVFSDRPAEGLSLYLGTDDLPPRSVARRQTLTAFGAGMKRYETSIRLAAVEQGLDPALLHAVIQVESGYNDRAVSAKGAKGLMQLMPETARSLGVANIDNPSANLRGGARYLRGLIGSFQGNLSLALAAYNAGEGAVRRNAMQVPPFAETQAYVTAVLRRYENLKRVI